MHPLYHLMICRDTQRYTMPHTEARMPQLAVLSAGADANIASFTICGPAQLTIWVVECTVPEALLALVWPYARMHMSMTEEIAFWTFCVLKLGHIR